MGFNNWELRLLFLGGTFNDRGTKERALTERKQ